MEGSSEFTRLSENFNMEIVKDDDNKSRSKSDNPDGVSGDDQDVGEGTSQSNRREKNHRHTHQQILELESFFKECPHPDEKERTELGNRLGLTNKQVKFWFQNRRTQMKAQLERQGNLSLRQENEKLQHENNLMKEAIATPICHTCGGTTLPGHVPFDGNQIGIENSRLKRELLHLCGITSSFTGISLSPLVGPVALQSPNSGLNLAIGMNGFPGPSNHGMTHLPMGLDFGEGILNTQPAMNRIIRSPPMGQIGNQISNERAMLIEVAMVAMKELIKMAQIDSPLWDMSLDGMSEVLNHENYARIMVPPCIGPKPNGYVSEATRESCLVRGNPQGLVEILMNTGQWSEAFPSAVARAVTIETISTGVPANRNGAILLIHAEVQLPSPLVPIRQLTFIRYCKQHAENIWAVVDVSVDIGQNSTYFARPIVNCRRLPSGCILQETSNGLFKVIWVEHNQYDENVIHPLYLPLINSGIGYGAKRWVTSLKRHFECLTTLIPTPIQPEDPTGMTLAGKRSMMKLAQCITNKFFNGVCFSGAQQWEPIHFDVMDPNIKVMARKSVVGEPFGIVLSAAASVWMPVSQQRLFDFLHDERLRGQWDVLANNIPMHELLHIPKGQVNGNCVSVLNNGPKDMESRMMILQDSWTDSTSSAMVYVAVDVDSLNLAINGGESAYLHLFPSGFVIHPDGCSNNGASSSNYIGSSGYGSESGGCLLTFGLQILLSSLPNDNNALPMESVVSVSNLIIESIHKIKVAL